VFRLRGVLEARSGCVPSPGTRSACLRPLRWHDESTPVSVAYVAPPPCTHLLQEKFLLDRIKVNGKVGNLGDLITVGRDKAKVRIPAGSHCRPYRALPL